MNYPELAWALLEQGDSPKSVIAFLCREYGLDPDQAKAAIILAQHRPQQAETPSPRRRPRSPRTRSRV